MKYRKVIGLFIGVLMIGAGLATIGLLAWGGYIKPLRMQTEARAEFKTFTPALKVEEPTNTPHPVATSASITLTASPTPLPPSPTPTPEPTDFLLEIPAIGLEWVVHEITEPDLDDPWRIPKAELDQYGVVRFPEMAFPGQPGVTAIAGHRDISGSPFLWLDKLEIGDEIQITLQDGTVISYKIFDKKYIDPLNLQVLDPQLEGEQELRLVTCLVGSIRKRLIVSAQHIEKGGS